MSVHNSSAGQVVDLVNLFGAVVQNLSQNRQALNQADTFNHNHGDNMVAIFETVTKALEQNQGAAPAVQLLQASKALAPNQSGSAQVYANGLAEAARQLQGQKQITPENAMTLVQALLGGGQGAAQGGDAAASLLGALLGGNAPSQPQEGAGDLLGALLGAVRGKWR
jgi:flagellum-specific peptidoglycan hydrolase FlgJ